MISNNLLNRLNDDLKKAMKSGDKFRLDTVRMLKAGWQKILIEKQDKITRMTKARFSPSKASGERKRSNSSAKEAGAI